MIARGVVEPIFNQNLILMVIEVEKSWFSKNIHQSFFQQGAYISSWGNFYSSDSHQDQTIGAL